MADKKETDLKKVNELIELMKENDLVEIEIVDGDNKILLKRPNPTVASAVPMMQAAPMAAAPAPAPAAPAADAPAAADSNLKEITSPMVGTFYSSPSPDSDAFVSVGSKVTPDTVVCIVEAMKVMNEIKAEVSGTIAEVILSAGQAVEFGQPMFRVTPN